MNTTVRPPEVLYRQVEAEARRRGVEVKDVVEEALRLALSEPPRRGAPEHEPSLLELMADGIGIFDSGVPDLATNPKYMAGYGR